MTVNFSFETLWSKRQQKDTCGVLKSVNSKKLFHKALENQEFFSDQQKLRKLTTSRHKLQDILNKVL